MKKGKKIDLTILAVLAAVGVGAYFVLKKPISPPPPGDVSAQINSFTITT